MLSYTDLKPGIVFIKDGQPYTVLDYQHVKKQRGKPIVQIKIKNLISGKVADYTAHQNDKFEEAEIKKEPAKFIYSHRGEFWFRDPKDPSQRFSMKENKVGEKQYYLKENLEISIIKLKGEIIDLELPVKVDLKITEAPPNIKGNTAEGGTKTVITETGLKVKAPIFIERGDVIRINTQTGEYTERVEKS